MQQPATKAQQPDVDYLTVSLHSPNGRHLPAIRAVQGDCQCPKKLQKFRPVMWVHNAVRLKQPQLISDQPIMKRWFQKIRNHI